MIHSVDPRQNRLFDPFQGVIPPAGQRIIAEGWQGIFRHVLLETMSVGELAQHFSRELGAPTKELYSMWEYRGHHTYSGLPWCCAQAGMLEPAEDVLALSRSAAPRPRHQRARSSSSPRLDGDPA